MKVCVVGAGVVGCATAYQLCRSGHEVVLLDQAAGPGLGTSFANGGQLSYSYVEPLASPTTLRGLPTMLLDADSPLSLRPRLDAAQWAWGLRFLAACTRSQVTRGTRQLLALATQSRRALERWLADESLDFGFSRNGKLVLCPDAASLKRQSAQVALQAHAGVRQEVLNREQCLAIEPALAQYTGFVGGIWTPSECAGDPHQYCTALLAAAARRGLQSRLGTGVQRFVVERGRAVAIETVAGPVCADAFVLATGISAPMLARTLGEHLPIYPVKGYSLTLAMRKGHMQPVTSVTDLHRKMVLAPLGGRLRVAALAQIVGHGLDIAQADVDRVAQAVEGVYPGLCDLSQLNAWAGLRPCTPTSVPIVRRSAVSNVILNVGHGALGFTLAAGCAQVVVRELRAAAGF